MGMDLHGKHGDEWFSMWTSGMCVCNAPASSAGVLRELLIRCFLSPFDPGSVSDSAEWDGIYHCNDGQQVSDRDARALGEALLRAVDALQAGDAGWLDDIGFESPVMNCLW